MALPPTEPMAIFAHVVDAQGFTAAAERLGISKSAVSKAVTALEAHLGLRLLHRTTRKLTLTEAGTSFYAHCSAMLAEATAAELAVGRLDGRPRGRLRVNAPTALGKSFVLPVVLEFLATWPDVEIDLSVEDDIVDLVATGTDLAVRAGRLVDGALVARKLSPVRAFLVASQDYLDRHGVPTTPEELARHTFIRYTLIAKPDKLSLENARGERAIVTMRGALSMNNGDLILAAVLAGVGIGVMPDFIGTDAFCDGRLKVILPDWNLPEAHLQVVYPQGGPVSPTMRLFIDALVAHAERLKKVAGDRPFALAISGVTEPPSPPARRR